MDWNVSVVKEVGAPATDEEALTGAKAEMSHEGRHRAVFMLWLRRGWAPNYVVRQTDRKKLFEVFRRNNVLKIDVMAEKRKRRVLEWSFLVC